MEKGLNLEPNKSETPSSREGVIIKRLISDLEADGKSIETASEEDARARLNTNKKITIFGLTVDGIIAGLKKSGYLKPPVEITNEEAPVEPEMISNRIQLQGIKEVEDPEIKEQFEKNMLFEELITDTFESEEDLNDVYKRALALEKNFPQETPEYYEGFEFLVDGGMDEIDADLKKLAHTQELFKEKNDKLSKADAEKREELNKIATIVECGIIHAVSVARWYGDSVSIDPVCKFNDFRRGVDGVLQITEKDRNTFLALAVDATYSGLFGRAYKNKFKKLLKSIDEGFSTTVKYFKNHQGEKMREFSVPKIVLYFDALDVKDFIRLVRNADNPEVMEDFKHSPQKISVLIQVLVQCKLLADFAEECGNPVYEQYNDFIEAVGRLAEKEPDIKAIIEMTNSEDDVSRQIKLFIERYKKGELEDLPSAA